MSAVNTFVDVGTQWHIRGDHGGQHFLYEMQIETVEWTVVSGGNVAKYHEMIAWRMTWGPKKPSDKKKKKMLQWALVGFETSLRG